jgi:hypothetical protein
MNLKQFGVIVPHLANITHNHGSLPSLVKLASAQYQNAGERHQLLVGLDLELRLLASGYESTAGNGSTFATRVRSAMDAVVKLDEMGESALPMCDDSPIVRAEPKVRDFGIVPPTDGDNTWMVLRLAAREESSESGPVPVHEMFGLVTSLAESLTLVCTLRRRYLGSE